MTASPPDISLIICAYNMARELPRTLFTLSPAYQRGIENLTIETLVLDNGSAEPVDEAAVRAIIPDARVIRVDDALPSPASAINAAVAGSSGQVIGLWIDGARMATLGLLALAHEAWRQDARSPVSTLAFHLGPDVQMRSVQEGYDAAAEDALLDSVPWREDGYCLFDISVLAGSSKRGWFGHLSETNGLFIDRGLWDRLGGLDIRFTSPGGGYVNLDFWRRAVEACDTSPWMILGEGTFHQVHGGAATNSPQAARTAMRGEYEALTGAGFNMPACRVLSDRWMSAAMRQGHHAPTILRARYTLLAPDGSGSTCLPGCCPGFREARSRHAIRGCGWPRTRSTSSSMRNWWRKCAPAPLSRWGHRKVAARSGSAICVTGWGLATPVSSVSTLSHRH